jgi:hypothetical protein
MNSIDFLMMSVIILSLPAYKFTHSRGEHIMILTADLILMSLIACSAAGAKC